MMLISRDRGHEGDERYALRAERHSTRINIESVPPRFPRDLDDTPLNLSRLQPLQRLFDRTKSSDERGLFGHTGFRLRHLVKKNVVQKSQPVSQRFEKR